MHQQDRIHAKDCSSVVSVECLFQLCTVADSKDNLYSLSFSFSGVNSVHAIPVDGHTTNTTGYS